VTGPVASGHRKRDAAFTRGDDAELLVRAAHTMRQTMFANSLLLARPPLLKKASGCGRSKLWVLGVYCTRRWLCE